jgi:hypothetical protein
MIRSPAGFDGGDRIKRYLDYYQPSYGVMMLSAGQFSPALLFAAGEQGAWYDPSDFSTMFQDSAGTTPVTAVEQPVGRILDKSGRGNTATQATSASRPVLSARVNQLTYSEQFENAAWAKAQATVSANSTVAPDGTTTADSLLDTAVSNIHYTSQSVASVTISNASYTMRVYAKASTLNYVTVGISDISSGSLYAVGVFNLSNGTLSTSGAAGTGYTVVGTPTITSVGNGWYLCSVTCTPGTSKTFLTAVVGVNKTGVITAAAGGFESYLGDGSGIFVWGADFRATNQTTLLPAYQRIAAATDYDTTGFPYYLRFDGSDDSLATATFTPGADKAQVFSGVRKNVDTATGVVAELSAIIDSNNGAILLSAPASTGLLSYAFSSKGTISARAPSANSVFAAAPNTSVLTGLGDIAGDTSTLRRNGSLVETNTADQGTGNYLAYPLYIGRRGGSTLPLNGRIYSLIIRFGANLDATTISNTETWVNGKTMAY